MEEKIVGSENDKMPKTGQIVLTVIVVLLIVLGIMYLVRSGGREEMSAIAPPASNNQPQAALPGSGGNNQSLNQAGNQDQNVKTFDVSSKPFEFSIKEIRVKKGDRVRINLTNTEGFHDWVVDEFNARTKQITAGKSDSVEFVADKTGTFEYYCSVGNHRQMGMVGKLIVE